MIKGTFFSILSMNPLIDPPPHSLLTGMPRTLILPTNVKYESPRCFLAILRPGVWSCRSLQSPIINHSGELLCIWLYVSHQGSGSAVEGVGGGLFGPKRSSSSGNLHRSMSTDEGCRPQGLESGVPFFSLCRTKNDKSRFVNRKLNNSDVNVSMSQ